jgi:hypothetical protein
MLLELFQENKGTGVLQYVSGILVFECFEE